MNIQLAHKPAAKAKVTGRPMWRVSLRAAVQRGRRRIKVLFCAAALKHCAACGPQVLGRAA
jgi:hypothetical protein